MSDDERSYGIRYYIEPWNKPVASPSTDGPIRGVRASLDNFGYCDSFLFASIVRDAHGEPESVLLIDSDEQGPPSRKMLELVKAQIEHQLEEHA